VLFADPWRTIAWAMLAFLVLFVALPLLDLARDSFVGERSGAIGFENYVTFFNSNYFRRALVNSINIQRKAAYTQKAQAAGATVEQMAFTSGCNLILQLSPGEKYKTPGGMWETRGASAPQRDSRCI